MAQRKVTILDQASEEVGYVAYFIESKGMPDTAKKFVDETFEFFKKLGHSQMRYRPCLHYLWKAGGYRCANYKKKYIVAFIDNGKEIIVCDFAIKKLLI